MSVERTIAALFVLALLAVPGCATEDAAPVGPVLDGLPLPAAAVTAASGDVQQIAPPPSVATNDLRSDDVMFLFDEQTVVLGQDLDVDVTAPGTYTFANVLSTAGTIPAGTRVSSHFIHAQPESGSATFGMSATFDAEILGIILATATLDASDEILGAPGTLYAGSAFHRRFIHGEGGLDSIRVTADRRTIHVGSWVGGPFVDDIRIVTAGIRTVEVDVKPGSDPNSLNLNGNGVVAVAVLGGTGVDVTLIDVPTVRVGVDGDEAAPVHAGHLQDADGDGEDDLVVHVREGDLGIDPATPDNTVLPLVLTGELTGGAAFEGSDDVRVAPSDSKGRDRGGRGPK